MVINPSVTATLDTNGGSMTIAGAVGGSGGLAIVGGGLLTLSNSSTFSGSTTISSGTLDLANLLAVQNSTVSVSPSGGLSFAAGYTSPTLGGLAGAGNVVLATTAAQSVTLNVGNNGQNTTYGGSLSGAGGLTKQGSGTLTFTAPSTYNGPTTIAGGVLQLQSAATGALQSAGAGAIGIHFIGNVQDGGSAFTGTGGVVPMSNWNNESGTTFSGGTLAANTGANSGATFSVVGANNTWATGSANQLLNGYISVSNYNPITLTVSNIPYARYSVYVYVGDSSVGDQEKTTINGVTYYYATLGASSTYTPITSTSPANYQPGNYVEVDGLTGGSQTLTVAGGGQQIGGLCSAEIVNTTPGFNLLPPATALSIAAGAAFDLGGGSQQVASLSDKTPGSGGSVINSGTAASVLTISPSGGSTTFSGTIQGGGGAPPGSGTISLVVNGSGTQVLAGSSSYTGSTTISSGTLTLAHPLAVQNSTVNVSSSGALNFAAGNTSPTLGGLAGAGNVVLATAAAQPVTLNVGNNGQSTTYSGNLSGGGGLTKQGSGVLTLNAAQSYSGPTVVSSGMLQLSGSVTGAVAYNFDNGTLQGWSTVMSGVFSFVPMSTANNNGGMSGAQSGSYWVSDSNGTSGGRDYEGDTQFIRSPQFILGPGNLTFYLAGGSHAALPANASSVLASPNTSSSGYMGVALENVSTGAFVLTLAGSRQQQQLAGREFHPGAIGSLCGGPYTLDLINQYSGGWGWIALDTVSIPTVGSNPLPVATPLSIAANATLDLGGGSQQVASLSDKTPGNGGSIINSNSAASVLTLSPSGGSTTFSGMIQGGGGAPSGSGMISLVVNGSGTQVLAGSNTYTGATSVNAATLQVGDGGSGEFLGSPTVALSNSALLVFNHADALTYAGCISGSGSLTQTGPGILTLTGSNTYTGGTAIKAGTLQATSTASLPGYASTGKITVASGGVLAVSVAGSGWTAANVGTLLSSNRSGFASGSALGVDTTAGNFSYASNIAGSMGLAKLGANTLTLSGSNTYTGPTTISQGELTINGSLVSPVTVNSGGMLGGSGSLGSVTVASGGSLSPGAAPGVMNVSGSLALLSGAQMDYALDTPADSDEVYMPSGPLVLSGQQFADFNFTPLGGFGLGTYMLIDTSSVPIGSLGTSNSGTIDGLPAYIAVQGDDVVLNVVPEPGTLVLLGAAAMSLLSYGLRRRRASRRTAMQTPLDQHDAPTISN